MSDERQTGFAVFRWVSGRYAEVHISWESCKEIRVTGLLNIFPFLGASLDDGGELAFNI